MTKTFHINEFRIEDLPLSCTIVLVAPPGYGKTSMIETLTYYRKHLYPVARAFIGTDSSYMDFSRIFGPLYTSNYYKEEEHKSSINRQRTCIMENGKSYTGNHCITIIDDLSDDPKIYKAKPMRGTFKNGSQHWAQMFLLGMQYAIDMPPDVRKSVSYVFIGRETEALEREKIYNNFGGTIPREYFNDLMDAICNDHTFIVIKKRSQSNDWLDNVFYLQTKQLPKDWKFGCQEYRKWNDARYNPAYVEKVEV